MNRIATTLLLTVVLSFGALAPAVAQGEESSALITLDADDTPVTSILQILASRTGLNIVTGPTVGGRTISIHLRDTPFEEALSIVARAAGLGYERIGRSILVADPAALGSDVGSQVKVFNLSYLDAADAQNLLKSVAPDVTVSGPANQIVVRGAQTTIDRVGELLQTLDKKPGQILLEARLIEVNTSALLEIGVDWEKITNWTTVVTEGNPGLSPTGTLPSDRGYVPIGEAGRLFRQSAAFQVAIDALITDGKARLLSNTKIVTLDNRPAEIFAGESVPVIITSLQNPGSAGGLLQTVQLEKIDVGVKLRTIARISDDGMITILAEPEVSRIIGFVGPSSELPETSTRRARTIVRVHDGEKIYLGGLLSDEKRTTVKKVPLLGSIPLIGHLFRHYRVDTAKLDLVIEITPRIVGDQGTVVPTPSPSPEDRPGDKR
jgi:type II secretory pathway component GspD/PulD (secretin)